MADAQPGGDVSQRGPAEYLDPLAPLSSQFRQLESMLKLVFDDYEDALRALTDDVLGLPPDERFTRSNEVLQEHLEERFGSTDAFAAVLPESDPEKLPAVLDGLFDALQADVLEGVYVRRNPDDHLVLAAMVQTLRYCVRRLDESDERETRNRIASTMLALVSRLQDVLAESPESIPDDAVRDTAYGLYYVSAGDDGPEFPSPEGRPLEEVREQVIEFGAIVAYVRLNISLGRGAELAGLPPDRFEAALDEYDVEPRFGPKSVEELYDDGIDE